MGHSKSFDQMVEYNLEKIDSFGSKCNVIFLTFGKKYKIIGLNLYF